MRLIDADSLLEGRQDHDLVSTHMIWNAKTIDAVPIVRCQDCNNWDREWTPERKPEVHYCWMIDLFTDGEFYCADAERRKTDGK